MQVTVTVSALVVHDDCLIIVKKEDTTGVSYILPGGRQEGGETLVGVEWVPIDQLHSCRFFFPRTLIPAVVELARGRSGSIPIYVGDVN